MNTAVIATNLETLEKVLYEVNVHASEAVAAIGQGEQNEAEGAGNNNSRHLFFK